MSGRPRRPVALRGPTLLAGWAALVLAPVAATLPVGGVLGHPVAWATSASGLAALAMLLAQMLSSGRFRLLSGRVGIDRTMRFHQVAARAAVALAALHVALSIASVAPPTPAGAAAAAWAVLSSPFFATGLATLMLLAAMVGLAVRRRRLAVRYEAWRAGHALAALGVAVLGTHHALSVGVASGGGWVRGYWWALAAVALSSLAWVYGVKPGRLARRPWTVARVTPAGAGVHEVVLEPAGPHRLDHAAGQFVWVLLDQRPLTLLDHPFSIASSPRDGPAIRLLVKARGDFTGRVRALRPGARAYVDGPHGHFTLDAGRGGRLLLVAGGIGIAPVLGLLRELAGSGDPRPVTLLYGARDAAELCAVDELQAMGSRPGWTVTLFAERGPAGWPGRLGVPGREDLAAALGDAPADTLVFVCGPPAMIGAVRTELRALGVPRQRVVFERFEYD